jgi:hypothetical protein
LTDFWRAYEGQTYFYSHSCGCCDSGSHLHEKL